MKRLVIPVLLTMLIWTITDGLCADDEQALEGPQLFEHQRLSVTLTIANPYDRAVRIKRLFSTCECFLLEIDQRVLMPYEETTLRVKIDNRNYSGQMRQTIYVEFTDGDLEILRRVLKWVVIPDVAIDNMPLHGPFDQRPELLQRDIYMYTAHERPDELHRLQKVMLVSSPEESRPEEGLQVTRIEYRGDLWQWQQRTISPGKVLIIGRARDPDATPEPMRLEEDLILHTNHPHKSRLPLKMMTAIDYDDNDPWSQFR